MKNEITPLELLRQEKERIRRECAESEDRLGEQWEYMSNNIGSMILQSSVKTVARKFGFGTPKDSLKAKQSGSSPSNGLFQGMLGGAIAITPILWDIAQPMILNYAAQKIKSIFIGKKKK